MNYGKKGTSKKKKLVNSKSRQFGKKAGVIFFKAFLVCMMAVVVVGLCSGVGIIKGVVDNAPDITSDSVIPRGYKSVVLDSQGTKTADLIAEGSNRIWVSIDQIPLDVQHAFVAVEDARFYEHNGIDIKGIVRAGVKGITNGFKFREGASTITQQLLKNSVFDFMSEDGFAEKVERKLQEQYLALKLEQDIMTKDEILEAYLNTINLGQNTLGIQAAANRYFGKDVSQLTISEAAVIAGITKNPVYNNPISYPETNRERQEIVLNDMLDQGYIDQSQYEEALADDVYSRIKNVDEVTQKQNVYSYYVDATVKEVLDDLQEYKGYTYQQAYNALYYGGLTIESAQDPDIQAIMDEEMQNEENYPSNVRIGLEYALTVVKPDGEQINYSKEHMIKYFKETTQNPNFSLLFDSEETAQTYIDGFKESVVEPGDTVYENMDFTIQPQASMVIMEQSSGLVKGVVGGRGAKEKSLTLNRATDAIRQPGSCFKIVSTYAPALDTAGLTLATTQFDAPYTYLDGTKIHNWDGEVYEGWTSLRRGIEHSMNIVAVKTITDITPDLGYSYLLNFGFTTLVGEGADGKTDIVQSTALGGITNGVTNLELTAAYAAIANNGVYVEPIFYTRVLDHDGNVLIEKEPQTRTVLKDTTAWLLTSAMKDVVTQGTGTAARFPGMTIAGKTGTTTKNNDIWFVGYTPYYTGGIWAGIDNNDKLQKNETNFHRILWKNVMSRVHEGLENKDFDMPADITSATVCSQSGALPIPGICDGCRKTEYFATGTVPTEYCDVHVVGTACIESNQLATDMCPGVEARIITMIPQDLQGPCSSVGTRILAAPSCTLHPGNVIGGLDPSYALPGGDATVDTGAPPPETPLEQPVDPNAVPAG